MFEAKEVPLKKNSGEKEKLKLKGIQSGGEATE